MFALVNQVCVVIAIAAAAAAAQILYNFFILCANGSAVFSDHHSSLCMFDGEMVMVLLRKSVQQKVCNTTVMT